MEVVEWDSRSSLMEYLDGSDENSRLLDNVEAPKRFYSLSARRVDTEFRLGFISANFGIKPAAIQVRDNCVLVGYDQSVTAVDLSTGAPKFDVRLLAPFYHFVTLSQCDHVIVVYEIGLVKLSIGGQIEWDLETEIIESVELDRDRLVVKRMGSSEPLIISMTSGKTMER
jgi:hypothetical protein